MTPERYLAFSRWFADRVSRYQEIQARVDRAMRLKDEDKRLAAVKRLAREKEYADAYFLKIEEMFIREGGLENVK